MSDELTARLDSIQKRADAATPGPWKIGGSGVVADREYVAMGVRTDPDAEFIANAPTDIGFLLDLARKQQAALDAVRELHAPDDEGDCGYCADYFCDTRKAEYPCPTIQALEAKP